MIDSGSNAGSWQLLIPQCPAPHYNCSVFTTTASAYVTSTADSYLQKKDFMVNLSSLWVTNGGGSFVSRTKFCAYYF